MYLAMDKAAGLSEQVSKGKAHGVAFVHLCSASGDDGTKTGYSYKKGTPDGLIRLFTVALFVDGYLIWSKDNNRKTGTDTQAREYLGVAVDTLEDAVKAAEGVINGD